MENRADHHTESDMQKTITLSNINQILSTSQGLTIFEEVGKKADSEYVCS